MKVIIILDDEEKIPGKTFNFPIDRMQFNIRDSRKDDFMLELHKLKRNFEKHPQFP